jgi:hypothetical protein
MIILNKVTDYKKISVDEFLALTPNTLKADKRDVKKLKNAIRKNGFSFPVIVWQTFIIDGAGRQIAVKEMIAEGDSFNEIPVVYVEAKDIDEAKLKALEVSSQFGDITKDSFLAYTEDLEIDFDTFEIKGIDSDLMLSPEDFDEDFDLPSGEKGSFEQMSFILSNEQAEKVKEVIKLVKESDTYKYMVNYGNENSNGNALALIAELWVEQNK